MPLAFCSAPTGKSGGSTGRATLARATFWPVVRRGPLYPTERPNLMSNLR